MHNILTDRLIRMDKSDGSRMEASLPEVYVALMVDEVEAFPALRPHQRHAWHAFLVQLGAMAMYKAGLSDPPTDAVEWADLMRGLSLDFPDDESWQLVVDDIIKPAFMQPPASSEDKLTDYKSSVETPDELDMLVTSKNHDVKSSVASQVEVDNWIFSLVTLQTMEGYGGSRNYGISRMPSGYGNRPSFSITPSTLQGVTFNATYLRFLNTDRCYWMSVRSIRSRMACVYCGRSRGTERRSKSCLRKGLDIFT